MLPVRIAGTGIAGLTLALALRRAGLDNVELFAPGPQAAKDPGLILPPNATRILNALGLGESLEAHSVEPTLMAERAWHSGYLLTQRPLGNFARQRYGAPHVVIGEAALEEMLHSQLSAYGPAGTGAAAGEALLVGCDGAASIVRDALGYPRALENSTLSAWRGRINPAEVPAGIDARTITTWIGPGQIFRHWPSPEHGGVELLAILPKASTSLSHAFQNWHPAVRLLLQHSQAMHSQPIAESPPISQWYHANQVLLGDACHLVHPYLQQSAALAMEDAWVLTRMLDRWEEESTTAFRDYERYRKVRINRVRAEAQSRWEEATLGRGPSAQRRNLRISLTNRFLPEMAMHQLDWLYGYDCISGFD